MGLASTTFDSSPGIRIYFGLNILNGMGLPFFSRRGKKRLGLGSNLFGLEIDRPIINVQKWKTHVNDAFLDSFRKQSCDRQIHPKLITSHSLAFEKTLDWTYHNTKPQISGVKICESSVSRDFSFRKW